MFSKIIRKDLHGIILTPIQEVGSGRDGSIDLSYNEMKHILGMPNATKLDDPDKVKASWGFQDQNGRKGFAWCYKYSRASDCHDWSCSGNAELLKEIFENKYSGNRW
jgi:hypothetical protein